jgi:hypothetical protein
MDERTDDIKNKYHWKEKNLRWSDWDEEEDKTFQAVGILS